MRRLVPAFLVALAMVGLAGADTLKLKAGGEVKGEIVSETDTEYTVATRFGTVTVKKDDVKSVDKGKVDESDKLKSKLRGVLTALKASEFVAAQKAFVDLREIPSPAWDSKLEQGRLLAELLWQAPEGVENSFRGLEQHLGDMTRDLCFSCEAHGDRECHSCEGKGREACRTCAGKPRLCHLCKGKGTQECDVCKGRGKLTCQSCAGSKRPGYIVTTQKVQTQHVTPTGKVWYSNDVKVTATPCGSCGGTPQYTCQSCGTPSGPRGRSVPGKVGCSNCNSMGRLPCEAGCENGFSASPCPTCNGSGREPCPDCAGTGRKGGAREGE